MQLSVQKEHGWVLAAVVGSWAVHHLYMALAVGKARKKFGVKYPALYADATNCPVEANRNTFNCVQRGHQNSLEIQPSFLALLLCAGLRFPVTSAIAGASFLVGRIIYFEGYATGKPEGRLRGALPTYAGLFTLIGCTVRWAWELINSNN